MKTMKDKQARIWADNSKEEIQLGRVWPRW